LQQRSLFEWRLVLWLMMVGALINGGPRWLMVGTAAFSISGVLAGKPPCLPLRRDAMIASRQDLMGYQLSLDPLRSAGNL
jgi:hypothetical protein